MKALTVCISISFAILLVVAFTPASGWVVRNGVDLLAGPDRDTAYYMGGNNIAFRFAPKWLTNPNAYAGPNAPEQLMHALLLDDQPRVHALYDYATSHPADPLGWAVAARMVCVRSGPAPDEPNKLSPADWNVSKADFELGLEESIKGEHAEPNNAYFPLLRAVFDMQMGHVDDMKQALRDAASKPHYNNHTIDQAEAMDQAELNTKGYRGEMIKTYFGAFILFPDLSRFKGLAKYLNRNGSLEDKRDLAQVSGLMANGANTIIEMLVAESVLKILVEPPIPLNADWHGTSGDEYRHQLAAFQDQLAKNDVQSTVPSVIEISGNLNRLFAASQEYMKSLPYAFDSAGQDDQSFKTAELEGMAPAMFLAAFVISLFAGLGAWLFSLIQSDTFRRMLPHLLCLPIWCLFLLFDSQESTVNAGLFIGLLQLLLAFLYLPRTPAICLTVAGAVGVLFLVMKSATPGLPEGGLLVCAILIAALPWFVPEARRTQIATYAGGLLVLVSFLAAFTADVMSVSLGAFVYVVARLLLWQKESGEPRKWTLAAVSVLLPVLILGAAGFYVALINTGSEIWGAAFGAAVIMLPGVAFFTCKPVSVARIAVGISVVTVSAFLLVAVGLEVRTNHQASLSSSNLLHEAAAVRKLAGV